MNKSLVQSANEQAYSFIRARILDGTYGPGELITEGEVAEAIGKSRTPVREAFLRLQSESFLKLFPKRGALVTTITAAEADDVLEARAVIESWCAGPITRVSEPDLHALVTNLRQELANQHDAVAADDNVAFQESDRQFHMAMIVAAGNSIFADIYARLHDRQLRIGIASVYSGHGRSDEILTQHSRVVEALERRDAADLRHELVGHIRSTTAAIGLAPRWSETVTIGAVADEPDV